MPQCPLCKNQSELKNSHVIPNTFFKRLKKTNGYSFQTAVDLTRPVVSTQESWAEVMFCGSCEDRMNEFDSYVASFTYSPKRVGATVGKSAAGYRRYTGIDYVKFRLFQLSLVYRAALSQREAYLHISLSPEHVEMVRTSILSRKVFSDFVIGCRMALLWNPVRAEVFRGHIAVPKARLERQSEIVYFIFGGFCWEFHLPKFGYKARKEGHYIKPNGTLLVPIIDFDSYPPAKEVYTSLFYKWENGLVDPKLSNEPEASP